MHVLNNRPLIVSAMGILAAAIFYVDTFLPLGVAGCVPYVLVVLISLLLPQLYAPAVAATVCTVLTYGTMTLLPAGSEWGLMFVNRSLAVFAIWTTALLGSRIKQQIRTLKISESRLQSDIAERKQVEQRQELQQKILKKIAEGRQSQSSVLNDLCLQIEQIMPSAICSIMVLDEITGTLQVGAVPSGRETACTILDGLVPSEYSGACGTAVHTRTTVIIEDSETDPRWEPIREAARPLGIKSCWSIPIFGEDQRILGTFAISHPQIRRPTPNDLQLLEAASSLASIALQRTNVMASLSESEKRYRNLYESAPLAYFTSHMDGRIKSANTSAVELLGYSLNELKDRSVIDLYAPTKDGQEKAQQLHIRAQSGKEIEAEELEMQRADGTQIWVSLTVRLIRDGNGALIERRAIVQDITARKKTEERLLLTQFVIDHAGDGILMAGPNKCILYANEAATQSLGYSSEQLIGKPISDISPNHEPQQFSQKLKHLLDEGTLQYESSHRTKQGNEFPVELTLSSLKHKGDQYTCAIVRDISDRKRGDELLTTQKNILEMISTKQPLSEILTHICLMVENHANHLFSSILLVEENVLRIGAAPSLPETYNQKIDRFPIGPRAGSCGTAAYRKAPVNVANIATDPLWKEIKHLALEYGLHSCWSKPILSSHNSVLGTFAMYNEKSKAPSSKSSKLMEIATSLAGIALEQQKADADLQKSEERYRSLYEDNPTMYFTVSSKGIVLSVNQFGAAQLGYRSEELIGKSVVSIFHEEDRPKMLEEFKNSLLNPQEVASWEFRKIRTDGSQLWVKETTRVIESPNQPPVALIVCEDITKRKQAEQLQTLQQMSLELTATGSPLSTILNALCTQVELMVPQAVCSILTLDSTANSLRFQAGPSVPSELATALDGMIPGPCSGSCGTATFRGEPVYVIDTTTDPLWGGLQDAVTKFNIRACWSYPIFSDGNKVLGSFAISSSEPHSPDPTDIQVLETVSFLAGIAIQRTQKEQALADSERRYRALYENNPSMYFTVALDGTILSVNHFGAAQLGYHVQELLQQSVWTLFLEEDQGHVKQKLEACLKNPQKLGNWESRKIRRDGKVIWVRESVRVVKDHENSSVFLIVSEDITQQKKTEELIRKGERKFRAIYEQAPTGIATLDSQSGRFTQINQKYCDIVGYSQEEIVDISFQELTHPDDLQANLDHMKQLLAGTISTFQMEKRYFRKNGKVIWVNLTCVPLWGDSTEARQHIAMVEDITLRKQVEAKLQEMNMALSHAMPGIAQIDPDGIYLEVNDSYADMLGYDPHELIGASWEPTVHSEDLPSAYSAYQDMLQTEKGEFEAKAIRKDGSTFYKQVLMVKKVDKNGKPIGHHCFMRDITERKFSEEALRDSETRLQGILDNSSTPIYLKDLEGRYLLMNRACEQVLNLDKDTSKEKTDFEIFPYEIAKALTKNDMKVLQKNIPMQWEEVVTQKDGYHTYLANKFPLRNAIGEVYAICGISTDITQRKQAEVNIRLHNNILESSPNGILITDSQKPDNPITYCNAAFERMTGYTQEEILGRNCRFLQKDDIDQDGLNIIRSALSREQECQVILRNYKKDGTPFWNDLRLAPVFDEKGHLNHYIGVQIDITERKSIDDSLRALAEAASTVSGEDFFPFIVKTLASSLNVKYAFITECTDTSKQQLRTLAFWSNPTFAQDFEYAIANTPCENVLQGDMCFYPKNIQQHFPLDLDLTTLGAESYVGYPLYAKSGEILGHLVAMDTKPIPNNTPTEPIIKLFATRVAAELERNKAEKDLQRSEGRLRQVIDLVPHFIFAKDVEGRFILCNEAVAKVYGTTVPSLLGKTDADFAQTQEEVDQFRHDDLAVIKSGLTKEIKEEQIRDAVGQTHYLQTTKIPFVFADSTLPAVLGVSTDITARKLAESQLHEAYNQTRELSARLEAAEESERKRIARELHDEFGQMLTGLKFDLSWIQRRLSEQPSQTPNDIVLEKTRSMTDLTDELIHMVRRIATSLRPSILDDLGLVPALEWHTKDFQKRTGIKCTFSNELLDQSEMKGEQATALFRIAQELFTNILRHADASRVKIALETDNEFLTLSVRDNGRGLGAGEISQLPSLGLLGIRERVASFGGDFQIQSKGKGTQARVRIPLPEEEPA